MQPYLIGAAPAVVIALLLVARILFLRADILALEQRNTTMAGELQRAQASLATTAQKLADANARVAVLTAAQADSVPGAEVAKLADGIDQLGAAADQIAPAAPQG